VTVLLYRDVDNDGVFEPGGGADGPPFATTVTDLLGHYLFAGLPNGFRWFVSIDPTQSALSGFNTLTTAADYDGNAANGHQRQVTPILTGGANRLDIDSATGPLPPFLSGRFFNDVNRRIDDSGPATRRLRSTSQRAGWWSAPRRRRQQLPGCRRTYTVRVTDTTSPGRRETTFEDGAGLAPPQRPETSRSPRRATSTSATTAGTPRRRGLSSPRSWRARSPAPWRSSGAPPRRSGRSASTCGAGTRQGDHVGEPAIIPSDHVAWGEARI
jgi:hypothetical protein